MLWIVENRLSAQVVQRCSVKKVFLKISQDSQEKTCVRVSVTCVKPHSATLFKMRLGQKCFPLSFEFRKILKLFFIEYLRWLLLKRVVQVSAVSNPAEQLKWSFFAKINNGYKQESVDLFTFT